MKRGQHRTDAKSHKADLFFFFLSDLFFFFLFLFLIGIIGITALILVSKSQISNPVALYSAPFSRLAVGILDPLRRG
jgi:hypothetical protein